MAELQEIMDELPKDFADLAVNSTEAISLNLTHPTTNQVIFDEDFPPTWTYAIFGEEETIVGYKDLSIRIDFRAHDLRPTVKIAYKQKMKPINEQMAQLMDVEGKLKGYLPQGAFDSDNGAEEGASITNGKAKANGAKNGISKTASASASASEGWTPPGELTHTYTHSNRTFQIWRSQLTDPRSLEILSNMRILVPFFIEGGTIDLLDEPHWSLERWKLFLLYEVDTSASPDSAAAYTLAGFATTYRLWVFPSGDVAKMAAESHTLPRADSLDPESTDLPDQTSPLDLLSRERISQFIILPPYQGTSHGSRLYNTLTSLFRLDPLCFEITVEEPNESFDVLRDLNDMAYLLSQVPSNTFNSLSLPSSISQADLRRPSWVPDMVDADLLFKLRAGAKLAPRQFQRLVEIHLLSTLPKANRNPNPIRITRKEKSGEENDRKYYFWRLMVKERLFVRNKDQLVQLDEKDRVPKLEEILPGVIEEYEQRIEGFERRRDKGLVRMVNEFYGNGDGNAKKSAVPKKRKVIEEDEDETESSAGEAKRTKKASTVAKGKGRRVVLTTSDGADEQNTLHE